MGTVITVIIDGHKGEALYTIKKRVWYSNCENMALFKHESKTSILFHIVMMSKPSVLNMRGSRVFA